MKKPQFEIPKELLPDGFAETMEHVPDPPATPRPAATIVLMRAGADSLEVLLLRRSRATGFVPGAWVFPGGRVDAHDASRELVSRVDGLTPETAEARLGTTDKDTPAIAYYLASIREAFEETGILVGVTEGGGPPPTAARDGRMLELKEGLLAETESFDAVLDAAGCRIDGRAVEYIAHWITPVVEPRRYDARFFGAVVPSDAEPSLNAEEMTDGRWITPARALEMNGDGTMPMVFPTIKTLSTLREFQSPREALAHFAEQEVPTIMPILIRTPRGVAIEVAEEI